MFEEKKEQRSLSGHGCQGERKVSKTNPMVKRRRSDIGGGERVLPAACICLSDITYRALGFSRGSAMAFSAGV